MEPFVSIIVPVYNAEKYLRRCVDSILNQEYEDFELILVDDGSKDSSGAICDEYEKNDSRVHVLHKENTGVSDSRNKAIDMAKGVYLQFLDSDDWMTPDATKQLVRAATEHNCDMVIADFYRVIGDRLSPKGDIEEEGVLTQEEFAAHMMENPADFYYGVLWNKLYRRDIIEKYKLRMNTEINWCEDFMFNLEYIRHAHVFYALHAPIYYYVKTKGSLVSQGASVSRTIKMKLTVFEYYNNFYKHVFEEEDYEKNRLQVYRFLIDAAGDGVVPPSIMPGSKRLGDERNYINQNVLDSEGFAVDEYRHRKLLEYYLETAAIKCDLTLKEARVLLYLSEQQPESRKELADFMNMSWRSLGMTLQRLAAKNLIKIEEVRTVKIKDDKKKDRKENRRRLREQDLVAQNVEEAEDKEQVLSAQRGQEKQLRIVLLDGAESVLRELSRAQQDYDEARFANFTEEELIQYAKFENRIKENITKVLK